MGELTGDLQGRHWAIRVWETDTVRLDRVNWRGYRDGARHTKEVKTIKVRPLPGDFDDRNPRDATQLDGVHFLVQARPDARDERLLAYQLRDEQVGSECLLVAVGRLGGVLDPMARAVVVALVEDYLAPRYRVRMAAGWVEDHLIDC